MTVNLHLISKFACLAGLAAGLLVVSSCDNIYDDPSEMPDGKNKANTYSNADATSYTNWVYLNFADGSQTTLAYDDTDGIPAEWTIAVHRYDIKTNSGAAYRTSYTSLDDMKADIGKGTFHIPDPSEFTADEPGKITIDMSHMMEGYIDYADASINKVLAKWLDVDTSSMPPVYTMDGNVYLLLTKDGSMAAVKFTGYSNPYKSNTKGYISLEYIYPIK